MTPHPFTLRDGRQFQLTKHPRLAHASAEAQAAAPWGIRMVSPLTGKRGWQSLRETDKKEAERLAKDLLTCAKDGPQAWVTHAEINHRRAGLTLGGLIDAYLAAGCPMRRGLSWTPRTGRALRDERRYLLRHARAWWGSKAASQPIHESVLDEYLGSRHHAERSVELEKNALSNACRYAVSRRKLTANPFAGLGNIRDSKAVTHCFSEMPASADELHALCRFLLADPLTAPYGAHLLFQAFTGLRPGEPGFLLLDPAPGQPGARVTRTLDDHTETRLLVTRLKAGINPFVPLHAALADFLAAWTPYVRATYPGARHLFPHPREPHDRPAVPAGNAQGSFLDKAMKRAAAACGVTANRRPHALRAYCGAVLLAQGRSYGEVAIALGEKTGEKMILDTYGNPNQNHGFGTYTWLPTTGAPAWSILSPPSNVIPLQQAA